MAKGGAVTLDTVMIKIESDAGKAANNIAELAKHLNTLKTSVKGGFNNINKLADALDRLVPTLKKLNSASKNLDVISNITTSLSQLKNVSKPTGFIKAMESLEKLPGIINKMDPAVFSNLKRVSDELSQSLTPVADKMQQIANGYSAFSKIQNTFGKSASTVTRYAKQQRNIFTSLSSVIGRGAKSIYTFSRGVADSFGKKAQSSLATFYSKFKQVYLSLLGTRTLFTLIRKGASEYMNFDQTLQKFATNVWRAFGAQLAPAIEYAMELFKQFVRVVYSVVYAITGIDLIAKANAKAMQSWGKAAKDTLGSLQKFDDLNVVDFPKASGNDNELISLDKIDLSPIQKIIDAVKNVKNEIAKAINTGKWRNVGKAIAKLINTAVGMINMNTIEKKLSDVAIKISNMLNGVIEDLSFTKIGDTLNKMFRTSINFLSTLIKNIEWGNLAQGLVDLFVGLDFSSKIDVVRDFIVTINKSISETASTLNKNWDIIKQEAREAGVAIGKLLNDGLRTMDWVGITTNITESLNTVLEAANRTISTFNWNNLGSTMARIINSIFSTFNFSELANTVSNFCHGLFETINSFLEKVKWGEIGYKLVTLILEIDWTTLSVDFIDFVQNIYQGLMDAASGVAASITDFLSNLFGGKETSEEEAKSFGKRLGEALDAGTIAGMQYSLLHPNDPGGLGATLEKIKVFIKTFFDIHSPSRWARDVIGKNLVAGMVQPFSNLWNEAKGMFETFKSKMSSFFSINNFLTFGKNIISGISSGLSGLTNALGSTFKSALNNGLVGTLNSAISSINNKLKIKVSSSIESVLKTLGANISSGYYQLFTIPSIPKLATGTNEIPYEGIYHLHPGEAVVPKKYNPALGNGGVEELDAKMDMLINIMNNMNFTNIVNVGNKKLYEGQQAFNKTQQNKYGTINLY